MTEWQARLLDPTDPLLRLLRAARAWGQPPTLFVDGPHPQVTTHTATTGGHVARSETAGWTLRDIELALALEFYEADLCPGCGSPLSETTKIEHSHRYVPRPPIMCHRCVAVAIGAKAHEKHEYASALLIPIELEDPT